MARYSNRTGRPISSGRSAQQSWAIGETVNIGFMRGLMVVRKEPTPGDYAPDAYHLVAKNGNKYCFVPHHGLERLD